MQIIGLQKLTLLDYPEKTAATIFTPGCDFRCPFCHNSEIVNVEDDVVPYTEESVLDYLRSRSKLLDGIAITGGEPLLQTDIAEFIKKVRDIGLLVKLDTNGSFPDRIKALTDAGLIDYVAMDIKDSPENYSVASGARVDLSKINESIKLLREGPVEYEFRTTVVKGIHTAEDFEKIADWLEGVDKYFLQSFKDSGHLIDNNAGFSSFTPEEMEQFLCIVKRKIPNAQLRGI